MSKIFALEHNQEVNNHHHITSTAIGSTKRGLDMVSRPADETIREDAGATYTYYGFAAPGTLESAAAWKIKRITNATNAVLYADGDNNFDNVWDNRASLSYS